jgi:hypothetical protein
MLVYLDFVNRLGLLAPNNHLLAHVNVTT